MWMRNLDMFVCNFRQRRDFSDLEKPLMKNGIWSRVDLFYNDNGSVVGFSTLHLAPSSALIPRIFATTREQYITLTNLVTTTNALVQRFDAKYGFHGRLDEFLKEENVACLPLSVIDLEGNKELPKILPLDRELFVALGGKLLM